MEKNNNKKNEKSGVKRIGMKLGLPELSQLIGRRRGLWNSENDGPFLLRGTSCLGPHHRPLTHIGCRVGADFPEDTG